MMMEDHKEWTFWKLLTEYMAEWGYFGGNVCFDKLPWSIQIEIKRITAVLNAFTGWDYDPSTNQGKQEIIDAFRQGFNQQNEICTNEQIRQLRELFSDVDDLSIKLENRNLSVCDFYRYLFTVYQASYNYVTAFDNLVNSKYTDAFFVVDAFKRKRINTHIVEKAEIIFKGFKILLGDMCRQKFSTSELIGKFGYPNVEYEKLVEFNKKWCRFHGIYFKDFRKSKKYTDRTDYSNLGFR